MNGPADGSPARLAKWPFEGQHGLCHPIGAELGKLNLRFQTGKAVEHFDPALSSVDTLRLLAIRLGPPAPMLEPAFFVL